MYINTYPKYTRDCKHTRLQRYAPLNAFIFIFHLILEVYNCIVLDRELDGKVN